MEKGFPLNCQWITLPSNKNRRNLYFSAIKEFELVDIVPNTQLHIAADTYYMLEINGEMVGRGPARGSRTVIYYDTWDVTRFLRQGPNQITVLVQSLNLLNSRSVCEPAAFCLELEGILGSDTNWQIRQELEWPEEVPLFSNQTGFCEFRDYRKSPAPWQVPEVVSCNRKLLERDIPLLRSRKIKPFSLEDGLADFKQEVVGFWKLEFSAYEDTEVMVIYDEFIENGQTIVATKVPDRFRDYFIVGAGRHVIGNSLHERGFRYLQFVFKTASKAPELHRLEAEDVRYPYEIRGQFECSDEKLNQIWELCRETVSACTYDTFVDCPWRERTFWQNDMVVSGLTSLELFGDPRIIRHCFRLLLSNRRLDGWLPTVCPDNDDLRSVLFPSLFLNILMLKDFYLYTGDRGILTEFFPQFQEILEFYIAETEDQNGILHPPQGCWNFIDWGFRFRRVPVEESTSIVNWMYVCALVAMKDMSEELGLDTQKLESKIKLIAEGTKQRFWNKATCRYQDFEDDENLTSMISHAFALLSSTLNSVDQEKALAALTDNQVTKPELFLMHYVLKFLPDEIALSVIRRYWEPMVDTNSPCVWEFGVYHQGRFGEGLEIASLCHAFNTTPVDYFQTRILGIRPLKPGFAEFMVSPNLHGLNYANGRVPTPNGNIVIRITKEKIELEVPPETTAVFRENKYLPGQHSFEHNQL